MADAGGGTFGRTATEEIHRLTATVAAPLPGITVHGDAALRPHPPFELGRRQQNLLAGVLRQVPVVRDGTAAPPPAAEVQQALSRFRPAAPGELEGAANQFRPRLLEALVGPEARRTGYIRGLPPGVLPQLLSAAGRGAERPIALRVVYGATRRLPLRALSYVIPAVHMAQRIQRITQRTPHLEIVLMGHIGSGVNQLPEDEVADELRLLGRTLARLLPLLGVKDGFGILTDRRADAAADLADLAGRLDAENRAEVLRLLAGRGGSQSEDQTLRYAAAHVLLHDRDGVALEAEHGRTAPPGAVRIDVGGLQERHFHEVRILFGTQRSTAPSSPLILTRHSVPPYTMARGGDIALRDYLAGTAPEEAVMPPAVRHDLRYLGMHLTPGQVASAAGAD
ncbi:hypothetical protein [Peterkaempfera bronchialis]|uniref:Uncharacterized protein n=1 Tax=Peterkaempfera bronchialis TaxID=2126346 RepID=A0A345T351_9ACTN|nr:hypothetical protein [Peterkaempfera bronchialis]AXI80406.1 hypothetical protein C7M71_026410 [Peterkaempfera bronchialis]